LKSSRGLLLLLLCALVAGCGGDGEGGRVSSTPAAQKTTDLSRHPGRNSGSKKVERYLRDNFGGVGSGTRTKWYGHVVEVSVAGTATTVRTDLSADRAGKRQARQICESVRGSIPGLTDEVRVSGLAQASVLASCVP
jgi:hypothetical protein